jgi:hypothetical protein
MKNPAVTNSSTITVKITLEHLHFQKLDTFTNISDLQLKEITLLAHPL